MTALLVLGACLPIVIGSAIAKHFGKPLPSHLILQYRRNRESPAPREGYA